MIFAVTADWHVDNMRRAYIMQKSGRLNREIDMDRQVRLMFEKCKEFAVQVLFIAGDLFDKPTVSGYHYARAVDYIRTFSDNGIRVVVLAGNHEVAETGSSIMPALERLRDVDVAVIEKISFLNLLDIQQPNPNVGSVHVLLLPHERRTVFSECSNYTSYVSDYVSHHEFGKSSYVVIGHFQPVGAICGSEEDMFSGSTRFLDTSIFVDNPVFCGHVHKAQQLGNTFIPGSIVKFTVAEQKEKKQFIIYDTTKREVHHPLLRCQPIREVKIDFRTKSSLEVNEEKLQKLKGCMLSIIVVTSKENRKCIVKKDIIETLESTGAKVISYKVECDKSREKGISVQSVESMRPVDVFKRVIDNEINKRVDKQRLFKLGKSLLEEVV